MRATLPHSEEAFNLREFLTLLAPTLNREELIYIRKLFHSEIESRTSLLCEMTPDECWMSVFRLVTKGQDLSRVFPLREVNKRWYNSVPSSFIEATIDRPQSVKGIAGLSNLQSLIIKSDCSISLDTFQKTLTNLQSLSLKTDAITTLDIPSQAWSRMTNFSSLELSDSTNPLSLINANNITLLTNLRTLIIHANKNNNTSSSIINLHNLSHLSHLSELNTWDEDFLSSATLERRYGSNYKILESLKKVKVAKLQLFDYLECRQIQMSYPEVRFQWCKKNGGTLDYYYEGEFVGRNTIEGKGIRRYPNGYLYEGEFKNSKTEGKGVCYFPNGARFEGDFKNGWRTKGVQHNASGSRYEGDFKDGKKEGFGVYLYSNGSRYEGQWLNNKREGEGKFVDAQRNRYQGKWKEDKREGFGRLRYSLDGHHDGCYDGEWKNDVREGQGVMVYPNLDQYEGEWKNDKREGKGTFIESNGNEYEGEWKNDERVM